MQEKNGVHGTTFLYEKHREELALHTTHLTDDDFKALQAFYLRAAVKYHQLSYLEKLKEVSTRIIIAITSTNRETACPQIYNQSLLSLMIFFVKNREAVKAEILAKRLIDKTQLIDKKLFNQLSYESNRMYWMERFRLASVIGLITFAMAVLMMYLNMGYEIMGWVCGWLGVLSLLCCKIYELLNRDKVSIDILEIFTVKNTLRDWLNRKFDINLGFQREVDTFKGGVMDIISTLP